jgi:hypothetical protein
MFRHSADTRATPKSTVLTETYKGQNTTLVGAEFGGAALHFSRGVVDFGRLPQAGYVWGTQPLSLPDWVSDNRFELYGGRFPAEILHCRNEGRLSLERDDRQSSYMVAMQRQGAVPRSLVNTA